MRPPHAGGPVTRPGSVAVPRFVAGTVDREQAMAERSTTEQNVAEERTTGKSTQQTTPAQAMAEKIMTEQTTTNQTSTGPAGHAAPEKRSSIQEACQRRDLPSLVQLATSPGGLLTDDLRRAAWPILLGCSAESASGESPDTDADPDPAWRRRPRHPDEDQVQLDVERAFVYYPKGESEQALAAKKAVLHDLIVSTLRTHPALSYFQSYHDVVQVLLLVLGEARAAPAVPRISLLRLRDYMLPTIAPARKHFEIVSAIVQAADPPLAAHIAAAENSFALAATHSLFAHDIQDYGAIARLYDFLLAHEPVLSLYLFASVTLSRRTELLDTPADESDMLTFIIAKLPQDLDLDALIPVALDLYRTHPPPTLRGFLWWRLSRYSVLKTSRRIDQPQDLRDADALCRRQIRQLRADEALARRRKLLWTYRRPLASLAAVLVGALSVWLRRTGHDRALWAVVWSAARRFSPG